MRLLPLSLNVSQVTNDQKSNDLLLPRYRTKCRRLEREAEQGLSTHPQEPLVCDTSYSTLLCVLFFVSRFVTTRYDSFEPLRRISVERDEGNQRTACESSQASFQTPRRSRAATGGSKKLELLITRYCKIMRHSSYKLVLKKKTEFLWDGVSRTSRVFFRAVHYRMLQSS